MGDICTNLDALLKDIRRNLTINNYSSFVGNGKTWKLMIVL